MLCANPHPEVKDRSCIKLQTHDGLHSDGYDDWISGHDACVINERRLDAIEAWLLTDPEVQAN